MVQVHPGPFQSAECRALSNEYERSVGGEFVVRTQDSLLRTQDCMIGGVAQLGEHPVCNREATGSIPVASTLRNAED